MTTNLDICTDALRKIGVVAIGLTASAEETEMARRALARMMRSWQNLGYNLWAVSSVTVPLTTAASYVLAGRPLELHTVRLSRSGIETPMQRFNREQYDSLPQKTSTGLPTCFYYDRQAITGTVYVWPVLAVAAGQTLVISYTRAFGDVVLASDLDAPQEWEDAIVYGLAARLMDEFSQTTGNVIARAEDELRKALAFDRDENVYFVGDGY